MKKTSRYVIALTLMLIFFFPAMGYSGQVSSGSDEQESASLESVLSGSPEYFAYLHTSLNLQDGMDSGESSVVPPFFFAQESTPQGQCIQSCTSIKTQCYSKADTKCGTNSSCLTEEKAVCDNNHQNCLVWAQTSEQCGN